MIYLVRKDVHKTEKVSVQKINNHLIRTPQSKEKPKNTTGGVNTVDKKNVKDIIWMSW